MKTHSPALLIALFLCSVGAAVEYEGALVHQVLVRTGKNLAGEGNLAATLTTDMFRVSSERKRVRETIFHCEEELKTDGTNGAWKTFNSLSREARSAWLAQNIKGLTLQTARRLVEDRYFDEIPWSWMEFKRRVKLADDTYETGFSYDVLVLYKEANLIQLGYMTPGQCGHREEKVEHRIPVRKLHRKESRSFELVVKNAPLLSFERELFSLSFDGVYDSLVVGSDFNQYEVARRVQDGRVVYELSGKRKPVRPSNTLEVGAGAANGELVLEVSDSAFDPEIAAGLSRNLVGTVTQVKGWGKDKVAQGFSWALAGDSAWTKISQTGIRLPPGEYVIAYEYQVLNSRYYGDQVSLTRTVKLSVK